MRRRKKRGLDKTIEKSNKDVKEACTLIANGMTRRQASEKLGYHHNWLTSCYQASVAGSRTWIWRAVSKAESERDGEES